MTGISMIFSVCVAPKVRMPLSSCTMYAYTCIYANRCVYIYIYIYIYIHTYIYIYTHVHVHVYIYIYIWINSPYYIIVYIIINAQNSSNNTSSLQHATLHYTLFALVVFMCCFVSLYHFPRERHSMPGAFVYIYIYIYREREREGLYLIGKLKEQVRVSESTHTHQRFRRVRAFGAQSFIAGTTG